MPVSISKRNEDEKEKMVVEGYAVRFNEPTVLFKFDGFRVQRDY